MTLLMSIRKTAQDCADLLSNIFNLEVSIVDEELNRVAGSNSHMSRQGQKGISVGFENGIMAYAMRTREVVIVDNPRESVACEACTSKDNCIEKYNISIPIIIDGRVYGGIGILALNDRQVKRIVKNREQYVTFFRQFADLLTIKAKSELDRRQDREAEDLVALLFRTTELGAAAVEESGRIRRLNEKAREILRAGRLGERVDEIPEAPGGVRTKERYELTALDTRLEVTGCSFETGLRNLGRVVVFEDSAALLPKKKEEMTGGTGRFPGTSATVARFRDRLTSLAGAGLPLLIEGGAGSALKEAALAVHEESDRCDRTFAAVDCRLIALETAYDYLFGSVSRDGGKGRVGLIGRSDVGTVFLEHAEVLDQRLQTAVMTAMREGVITKAGSFKETRINTVILVSFDRPHADLLRERAVAEEWLCFLRPLTLAIPPLSARPGDVRPLIDHLLMRDEIRGRRVVREVEAAYYQAAESYDWPGDRLELESLLKRDVSLMGSDGVLRLTEGEKAGRAASQTASKSGALKQLEAERILEVVSRHDSTTEGRKKAAEELGISVSTLYRKLKELD